MCAAADPSRDAQDTVHRTATVAAVVAVIASPGGPGVRAEDAGSDERLASEYADMELSELLDVTVTSTKRQLTTDQAPSVVEVIDHETIRRRGYRTVAEALRGVVGVALIDDHTYVNIGVRGFHADVGAASDVVKLMINGQPVSFRATSENFLGHELVPITAVRQIEVIRGPGSALYGANALLGVINIVTFTGAEADADLPRYGVRLAGQYTQNEHDRGLGGTVAAHARGVAGRFRYLVATTFHRSDSPGLALPGASDALRELLHRQDPALYPEADRFPSPGWDIQTRERLLSSSPSANERARTGSAYALADYQLTENAILSADANLQYFDRHGEFLDFSHLTHRTRLTYLNAYGRLRFALAPAGAKGVGLTVAVAVAGGAPTGAEHIVVPLTQGSHFRRDFGYTAVDTQLEASYALRADHVITAGADLSLDREELLSLVQVDDASGAETEMGGPGRKTFVNAGVYGQWLWHPTRWLGLLVGGRLDHNNQIACDAEEWDCIGARADTSVPGLNPGDPDISITARGLAQASLRAGLVMQHSPWRAHGKLLYGSSFKPPSPFQLYHQPLNVTSTRGNPALRPQTADTFELSLGWAPVDTVHLSFTAFSMSVTDKVVYFKEGGLVEGRNADGNSYGIELGVRAAPGDRLSLQAGIAYLLSASVHPQRARGETEFQWRTSLFNHELDVPLYPELRTTLSANYHVAAVDLDVNCSGEYVGPRRASLGNGQLFNPVDLTDSYQLPAYVLGSVTISRGGLRPFGGPPGRLEISLRDLPGGHVEPGNGGLDIPGAGPSLHLLWDQSF